MNEQVLSIERMQHLKELGLDTSKASMCWRRMTRDFRGEEKIGRWSLVINQPIIVSNFETYEEVPAFTLQDILDLLPSTIHVDYFGVINKYWLDLCVGAEDKSKWFVKYMSDENSICKTEYGDNLLDAAYDMLCWCIENGYINIK